MSDEPWRGGKAERECAKATKGREPCGWVEPGWTLPPSVAKEILPVVSPLFPRRSSPRPLYVHQRALQPPSLFCSPLSLTPSPTPNTMRASSLVAFSALSFALPYLALANDHSGHARRHHDIAARHPTDKRDPEVLSKRYDNMRFTFYDVGL